MNNHPNNPKTTASYITMSKLYEDAKVIVACLSPTRCEEALVFNQENPEKHFQNKATGKRVKCHFYLTSKYQQKIMEQDLCQIKEDFKTKLMQKESLNLDL